MITIAEQSETSDFYTFVFSDGATCSVGKQSEGNPNGAANYDEAIEILKMNFEGLEIW